MSYHTQFHGAANPVASFDVKYYSDFAPGDRDWGLPPPSAVDNLFSGGNLARWRALIRGKADYSEAVCKAHRTTLLDGVDGAAELAGELDSRLRLMEGDLGRDPSLVDGSGQELLPIECRGHELPEYCPSLDSPTSTQESISCSSSNTVFTADGEVEQSTSTSEEDVDHKTSLRQGGPLHIYPAIVSRTVACGPGSNPESHPTRKSSLLNKPPLSSRPLRSRSTRVHTAQRIHAHSIRTPSSRTSRPSPPSSEASSESTSPETQDLKDGLCLRSSSRRRNVPKKCSRADLDIDDSDFSSPEIDIPKPSAKKKSIPCSWSKVFGGTCNYTASTNQLHDRHILTHLPDEDGYETCHYRCSICKREFPRDDSCNRHVQTTHHERDGATYRENFKRQWWWPADLFRSSEFRKNVLPAPSENTYTWKQRLEDIIVNHPGVVDKPRQRPKFRIDNGDSTGTRRPTKRRRFS